MDGEIKNLGVAVFRNVTGVCACMSVSLKL